MMMPEPTTASAQPYNLKAHKKYTTTMTMKATNTQPPPLFLPDSAFFPSLNKDDENHFNWAQEEDEAVDPYFDDTSSVDSMSTITTTYEASDDMFEFVVAFDHPCVVVYLLDHQEDERDNYCNTLQPHYRGGGVGVSDIKEDNINTKVALLLMTQLEKYYHVPLPKMPIAVKQDTSIIPLSKDSSWRGNHYSYDSLPTFRVPDANNIDDSDAPLPTYLVRPRKGYHDASAPAAKRFRVTPMSSPLRGSPAFIPPVYISVPNPLVHHDD